MFRCRTFPGFENAYGVNVTLACLTAKVVLVPMHNIKHTSHRHKVRIQPLRLVGQHYATLQQTFYSTRGIPEEARLP